MFDRCAVISGLRSESLRGTLALIDLKLSEIWRFPVKSLRGQRFTQSRIDSRGFQYDRHWMVVGATGKFLTQRQYERMALVDTSVTNGKLQLRCVGMPPLDVDDTAPAESLVVQVWSDRCEALAVDPRADEWLSTLVGEACRLVVFPGHTVRLVDPEYGRRGDQVGFADGFPFLLIGQASLDDLNARLADPVPIVRFRPNLVVTGAAPYAEDRWRRIRIGDVTFRVVKPCSRCVIPTIDPLSAQRSREPLKTLATYRRRDNKIYFGQNLVHDGWGELHEGMSVDVLEWADG